MNTPSRVRLFMRCEPIDLFPPICRTDTFRGLEDILACMEPAGMNQTAAGEELFVVNEWMLYLGPGRDCPAGQNPKP